MNTQTKEVTREQAASGGVKRLIREVKERTRKRFSSEEKIRIVLEGFRGELPVSELCRKESLSTGLYYSWLKDFMEAGKERLKKDYQRDATRSEVKDLRQENSRLKELLGDQALQTQLLKKSLRS